VDAFGDDVRRDVIERHLGLPHPLLAGDAGDAVRRDTIVVIDENGNVAAPPGHFDGRGEDGFGTGPRPPGGVRKVVQQLQQGSVALGPKMKPQPQQSRLYLMTRRRPMIKITSPPTLIRSSMICRP